MRVLLVAPHPFYAERGTPIAVRTAAETLCRAGYRVDLLTYHVGEDLDLEGLRILRIPRPPFVASVPIGFSWKKMICDLYLTARAILLLKRGRYQVVHAVEEAVFPMAVVRALRSFRLVYDMDSLLSAQLIESRPRLARLGRVLSSLEAWAIRRSDLVLAVCPAIAEHVAKVAPKTPVYLTHDVPVAQDVPHGPAEDLRTPPTNGDALALYVGNLERYQGMDLLLEAMAHLGSDGRITLAVIGGEAADVEDCRARARALGVADKVRFLGPRPLRALPAYLEQADFLVSPRLHGINTPMKIYAYMASGRPIVATDVPSHVQVLDPTCAVLVAPEPSKLAEGMLRLANDDELGSRIGERGARKSRQRYGRDAFDTALCAAYDKLRA